MYVNEFAVEWGSLFLRLALAIPMLAHGYKARRVECCPYPIGRGSSQQLAQVRASVG